MQKIVLSLVFLISIVLFSVSTFSQEQCQGDISVDNQKNEVEFREQNGFGTSNIPFDNMEQFSNTGTTNHWHQLTNLQNGNYVYYVKCSDAAGNVNSDDYTISFTVSQQPGNYRRLVIINNRQNPSVLSDYQIPITIDTNSLILAGKMRSDCGDIRFTDSDGSTQLSYWLESGCNTASTKIWVKVPSIPANSAKIIYLYYGDPLAPSASNGDNTFIFFDDFSTKDTTKWNWPSDWTVENGYAKQTYSFDWPPSWVNAHTFPSPLSLSSSSGVAIETSARNLGTVSAYDLQIGVIDGGNRYETNWAVGNFDRLFNSAWGNWDEADTRNGNTVTLTVRDGEQKIYINGILKKTTTTAITTISKIEIVSKGQSYWDWVRVRKYTSPEPSVSVGDETPSQQYCTREVLTPGNNYTYIYLRRPTVWNGNVLICGDPYYWGRLDGNNLIVCDTGWNIGCTQYSNSCPPASIIWPEQPRIYNSSITFPSIPSGRILVNANFSIYFNYNGCASVDVRVRNQQGSYSSLGRIILGELTMENVPRCNRGVSPQWVTLQNVQNNLPVGQDIQITLNSANPNFFHQFSSSRSNNPPKLEVEYCLPDNTPPTVIISNMNYRRDVRITERSNKDLFEYPVAINLNTQSLISQGKMKPNCADIRVIDEQGNFLNYWTENCNSPNTKVWVKIPTLEKNSRKSITLFYGNNFLEEGGNRERTLGNQFVRHWAITVPQNYDKALTTDPNGNIFILTQISNKCKVTKYSPEGSLLWEKEFDISELLDDCRDIAANNQIVAIVGSTENPNRGFIVALNNNNGDVIRMFYNDIVSVYRVEKLNAVAIRGDRQIVAVGILRNLPFQSVYSGILYFDPSSGSVSPSTFAGNEALDVDTNEDIVLVAGRLIGQSNFWVASCSNVCTWEDFELGNYFSSKIKSDGSGYIIVGIRGSPTKLFKLSPSLSEVWSKYGWWEFDNFAVDKLTQRVILRNGTILNSNGDIIKTIPPEFIGFLLEYDAYGNLIIHNSTHLMKFSEALLPQPLEPLVEISNERPVNFGNSSDVIVSRNVIVSVGCQDTGWGCNRNSFRILKTNSQTCPTDYNQYTIDGTVPLFISQDTYLCAAAKDRAGNIGFSSVRIDIDVTPPSISATHTLQPEGEQTRLTVTANADDGESRIERIEIYIDNSLVQTCPTTSCQYSTLLNPGNYNYLVKAYDNAGNEASFSRNIYVGVTQYSFEFERGWNLFSLPFRSFTINANSCTENKFFHWDSENRKWETVIGIENLQPVGYWFYTDKKCGIHVTGSDPLSPEDLQLRTGWNQIATLSPAFPTATFQSIKGSCTLNQILYYNSTTSSWKVLSETDRFESYKGYLIKATC
ncbi:MAG: DUF2341 domain-containing protein [Candidatus Aenigmarchaeota archaeon]|nr:DUF2341 domain-containing protein [Candidatus Aenigmarchaeota archaeon]